MMYQHDAGRETEKRLEAFFQRERECLKAPADLWARVEPGIYRLTGERRSPAGGQGRWLSGMRLAGVAVSLLIALVLLGAGGIWLAGGFDGDSSTLVQGPARDSFGETSGDASVPATTTATASSPLGPQGPAGPAFQPPVPTTITFTQPAATTRPTTTTTAPSDPGGVLDIAQRQVISTGSVSLEVKSVPETLSQVRSIAESLGGLVENLNSSGAGDQERATVTIRVPQDRFFTALERLQTLGTVQSQQLGSQDVTDRFIDLDARLRSLGREEQSLLSLLDRTQTISEIMSLERELSRVRSEIESIQGQLNFLQRSVDLATISISLATPPKDVARPPSGSLTVQVSDIETSLASIKSHLSSVGAVVDKGNTSQRDGQMTAVLSARVFRSDFDRAMDVIASQGEVRQKEVQEAIGADPGQPAERPDARIDLVLTRGEGGFWTDTNIVLVIAAGIVLLALAGFFLLAQRAGLFRRGTP